MPSGECRIYRIIRFRFDGRAYLDGIEARAKAALRAAGETYR